MFNIFRKKDKYQYSQVLASQLITVIKRIKVNIADNSDMTYCYYESPAQLIGVLDQYIEEIEQGNIKVIEDLAVEFAPTSSLQEHSLNNGWSDEYLKIAKEFDSIEKLAKK